MGLVFLLRPLRSQLCVFVLKKCILFFGDAPNCACRATARERPYSECCCVVCMEVVGFGAFRTSSIGILKKNLCRSV